MTDRARWRFEAIGTTWEIETSEPLDETARRDVASVIADFDASWSRFRDDSLVSGLASQGGTVPAPRDAAAMLGLYSELSAATDGAVNPLVGESLARRGYDATLSLIDRGAVGAPADWEAIVQIRDGQLTVRDPALIDVGALGKGRLVDLVLAAVTPHTAGTIVVDASGDLAVRGASQRIGLEHPYDPSRAVGVWEVTDAALCASAINRRAWGEGLHHVLDARTGQPVRTIAATWAVAPTAMHADAIATGLFFDGGPRLAHEWGASWVRMTTDGRLEWSPGCSAELFVAGSVGA
ncbi:FAD:protein FMN transferase [Microbacterium sp. SLBN-146]|uniref:FAD:protein FMN transferase n=1 Tax=Microbacterium sp. SLBN-146 TaxID=2768457 RepID=UPI0011548CD9|nr:FAD:protein FMN transferase [Microbacterium sp. SLBN-146]TQJ31638.1 thiamine biosynthesis lipoprotein [Microbacterium sp. SLBN-146]